MTKRTEPVMSRVTLTPKLAEEFLNANKGNRPLRPGLVDKYAADMRAGAWTECSSPIIFDTAGVMTNGQHRCWAVIEAGTPQPFFVIKDFPVEAKLNIDTNATHSFIDNAHYTGFDQPLSPDLIAVIRAFEFGDRVATNGKSKRALTNSEMYELVMEHYIPCRWAIQHGPSGRYLRNSCVLAAIARAFAYEKDHERLKAFAKAVTTGIMESPRDVAAIVLRNRLLEDHGVPTREWRPTFLKVQQVIHNFMRGRQIKTLRPVEKECYPKPRQESLAKAA